MIFATANMAVLASVGAEGQLRIWDARGQPTFQWSSPGGGPITCLATVAEDGLLVAGQGLNPSLLSLNYSKARHLWMLRGDGM
eukprot:s2495_g4.t1